MSWRGFRDSGTWPFVECMPAPVHRFREAPRMSHTLAHDRSPSVRAVRCDSAAMSWRTKGDTI
jgi:hypothetical protein